MLSTGQILGNRYQLQKRLGHNAGRQTWLATDTRVSPPAAVVIKWLAFNSQMQWDELKLFQREAQVLKNLNHPRIPKYLDYFSVDAIGAGLEESSHNNYNRDNSNVTELPWFGLVQEYIPGDSLKHLLEQGKQFGESQVYNFAEDMLNILIYLHELSPPVLHRDIKPSNLILGKNNQLYLVDFGAVQDKAKAEGVTFTVVGTSGYAPPEQLWGKAVPASDLYALGATLVHLLTGIPPAKLPHQRMRIKFKDKIRINSSFADWIEQLIQPAPEKRLSTARQALSSLQSFCIDPPSQISFKELVYRFLKRDNGYGCGCLALIGFLGGAILLFPPFFNKVRESRQSQANQSLSSLNHAQYYYFHDNNKFTDKVEDLERYFQRETEDYTYSINTTPLSVTSYSLPKKSYLKGYVSSMFVSDITNTNQWSLFTISCQAKSPGTHRPPAPILEDGVVKCAPETVNLSGNEKGTFIGKDWNLTDKAAHYAKAGDYNQALDIADNITEDWFKAKTLNIIVTELAAAANSNQTFASEYSQVMKVTQSISDDWPKESVIQAIIPYLTTSTHYEQAIQMAQTLTDSHAETRALNAIVRRLVATGEDERAVKIAESIYGSKEKAMAVIARYKNLQ